MKRLALLPLLVCFSMALPPTEVVQAAEVAAPTANASQDARLQLQKKLVQNRLQRNQLLIKQTDEKKREVVKEEKNAKALLAQGDITQSIYAESRDRLTRNEEEGKELRKQGEALQQEQKGLEQGEDAPSLRELLALSPDMVKPRLEAARKKVEEAKRQLQQAEQKKAKMAKMFAARDITRNEWDKVQADHEEQLRQTRGAEQELEEIGLLAQYLETVVPPRP